MCLHLIIGGVKRRNLYLKSVIQISMSSRIAPWAESDPPVNRDMKPDTGSGFTVTSSMVTSLSTPAPTENFEFSQQCSRLVKYAKARVAIELIRRKTCEARVQVAVRMRRPVINISMQAHKLDVIWFSITTLCHSYQDLQCDTARCNAPHEINTNLVIRERPGIHVTGMVKGVNGNA